MWEPRQACSSLLWAQLILLLWVTLGKQGKEHACQLQNEPIRKAVLLPSALRGYNKEGENLPFTSGPSSGPWALVGSSGSRDLVVLKETPFYLPVSTPPGLMGLFPQLLSERLLTAEPASRGCWDPSREQPGPWKPLRSPRQCRLAGCALRQGISHLHEAATSTQDFSISPLGGQRCPMGQLGL